MPEKSCAALNCPNSIKNSMIKRFFKFPMRQECAKKWIIACRRDDLLRNIDLVCQTYSTYFICEDHFEDAMFQTAQRCRLLPKAVPTIFPEKDILELDTNIPEEITVKEEPLIDPIKIEMEVPVSPPFVNCDGNDETSNSYSPQFGTIEFLPEEPTDYPSEEMECSSINISDDEETNSSDKNHGHMDSLSANVNHDSSIDLTTPGECFPALPARRPHLNKKLRNRLSKHIRVDLKNESVECRTCLVMVGTVRGAPLYEKCHPKMTIKEMISFCIPQLASTLADRDIICNPCLKKLRQCFNFIEDCLSVENTLMGRQLPSEIEFVEVQNIQVDEEAADSKIFENTVATSGNEKSVSTPGLQNSNAVNPCQKTFQGTVDISGSEDTENNQSMSTPVIQNSYSVYPYKEMFKCSLCWKYYRTKYMLEDHERKIHNIEREGGYYCQVCLVHFEKLKELEQHWMTHFFYCSVCDKRFTEHQVCDHIKKQRDKSCQGKESINYSLGDFDYEQGETDPEKVLYNCYKCDRMIQGESRYVSHIKLHGSPEKLFFCDQCPKSYGKFKVLRYHQMMSHEKVKSSCKFCSTMVWNFNMPSHYRTRHANEPMHFCKICDDAFQNLGEYKSHLREHIAMGHVLVPSKKHESPSKNCDKTDKMIQGTTSENVTRSAPFKYKCTICVLKFRSERDLSKHQRTHNSIPDKIDSPDQIVIN
ncbi:unnamed protein product [Phaedon cochleariae]|uniref:Zinc finger protein n=1 Tax=Phaedon cochleariae TaxID=80249 RepID=A0A9N9SA88_PHACE|nr:unnamed protein product [Phaedon cochleariae]